MKSLTLPASHPQACADPGGGGGGGGEGGRDPLENHKLYGFL